VYLNSKKRPQYALIPLVLLTSLVITACGGSEDDSPADTSRLPDSPVISQITAGDGAATITFSEPDSSGGQQVTAYTATCSDGSVTSSGTASVSPVVVDGLTNGATYTCSMTATNSIGNSVSSNEVDVTPLASGGTDTGGTDPQDVGTSGIECDYAYSAFNDSPSVNLTSTANWSCTDSDRVLSANGIPDHEVGIFPNAANPNTITEQTVSATFTLAPVKTDQSTQLGGPAGTTGFMLNGIKIDAGTGGSCDETGSSCSLGDPSLGPWSIEALTTGVFDFGTDSNNAHVQPGGSYHYHGMPENFITERGGNSAAMTLIGWAADGFPIYARYGHAIADQATSSLKVITGSYQLVTSVATNRPPIASYPLGTFRQDWEYVEGSGDLDECNGRTGVTPEFPNGIYHYFATDTYPFLQRCVKGEVAGANRPPPPGGG